MARSRQRYRRNDGAVVWVHLTVGCVRKKDGSIDYVVSVVEDTSARKQADNESQSEQRGSMAKRTVGGEIQLEYAPAGLMWALAYPVDNALERGELLKPFRFSRLCKECQLAR